MFLATKSNLTTCVLDTILFISALYIKLRTNLSEHTRTLNVSWKNFHKFLSVLNCLGCMGCKIFVGRRTWVMGKFTLVVGQFWG